MYNSLSNYLFRSLDRMVDITPYMEMNLKDLFKVWNADNIDINDFRCKYGFPTDSGVFMILPFMIENIGNQENAYYSEEANISLGSK